MIDEERKDLLYKYGIPYTGYSYIHKDEIVKVLEKIEELDNRIINDYPDVIES